MEQGRVKKILKLDHDVKNISKEAIVAITKATELFVAYMVRTSVLSAVRRSVYMCGVVWCGVAWCGVVRCGVV